MGQSLGSVRYLQKIFAFCLTGYAETIGGVIEKESGISRRDWHQVFSGVARREIILMAGTALAYSYHKALSTKVDEV